MVSLDSRAKRAKDSLFDMYDSLNTLWGEAEKRLVKYHIPEPVSIRYESWYSDPNDPSEGSSYREIGLQKISGKWRICHGESSDRFPEVCQWTPIVECSAEVRVRASEHLEKLRLAVVEMAESFIPKVDTAIKHLMAFTQAD